MFYSKKLKKFKNVRHGFFNRAGGFSKGIYKSLNCGLGSEDKIKVVKKNMKLKLTECLKFDFNTHCSSQALPKLELININRFCNE